MFIVLWMGSYLLATKSRLMGVCGEDMWNKEAGVYISARQVDDSDTD